MKLRKLELAEPYCYSCVFDPTTGQSFCACGKTYEQRKTDGFKKDEKK